MTKEFINYYKDNLVVDSKLISGVYEFLIWCKKNIELLKKIKIYNFFEYVAGGNTFDYCKPDPRHITNIVEIIGGDIKKTIMIGDSENDADAAKSAGVPMILLEDGYTEKKVEQIHHDHLIKDFINLEKIIKNYM